MVLDLLAGKVVGTVLRSFPRKFYYCVATIRAMEQTYGCLRRYIWAAQTDMVPVMGKRFPQMTLRGHSSSHNIGLSTTTAPSFWAATTSIFDFFVKFGDLPLGAAMPNLY